MDPDCQLGMLLKAYFKKESLVSEVFGSYMKENYFTRSGLDQSSFNLNVAACRVVLDILPGLEVKYKFNLNEMVFQKLVSYSFSKHGWGHFMDILLTLYLGKFNIEHTGCPRKTFPLFILLYSYGNQKRGRP